MLHPRPGAGYTLLEMIVVVMIIATVAAMATPRMQRVIDARRLAVAKAELASALAELPLQARATRSPIELGPDVEWRPEGLPEGWTIQWDSPLVVHANGVCGTAALSLLRPDPDPPLAWRVLSPLCRLEAVDEAP